MKTSWLGPRPVTASSSVSRRATRMYGSRLATAAPRLPPPAPATEQKIRNPRPGHVPTPPRPRPDRARPALPQELAATTFAFVLLGFLRFRRRYPAEQNANPTLSG